MSYEILSRQFSNGNSFNFFNSPDERVKRIKLNAGDVNDTPFLYDFYEMPIQKQESEPSLEFGITYDTPYVYDANDIEPTNLLRQGSSAWFSYCDKCDGRGCSSCVNTELSLLQASRASSDVSLSESEQQQQLTSQGFGIPSEGFNLPAKPEPEVEAVQESGKLTELLLHNEEEQLNHPVSPAQQPLLSASPLLAPRGRLMKFLSPSAAEEVAANAAMERKLSPVTAPVPSAESELADLPPLVSDEKELPVDSDDEYEQSHRMSTDDDEWDSHSHITPTKRYKRKAPSRDSPAATPIKRHKHKAHIERDRHVKAGVILKASEDGSDGTNVAIDIIWYKPPQPAAKPIKIRLIKVTSEDGELSIYAHGADVGGVVERKSNISRLFGKFDSPSEKLLMNVVGAHNHTVGQQSNILTELGVLRFLTTNKFKAYHDAAHYRRWLEKELIPRIRQHIPSTNFSNKHPSQSRKSSIASTSSEEEVPSLAPTSPMSVFSDSDEHES